ncbi:helix-turn-helix protein [Rhizobium sp. PP-F2F-G38]|nr:helix-turn-helix protein [Rhizobium sp. PP-WC-1G-195]PYE40022.1 helix-turn-helix protein [Rhizobium sp. PP-F2F-G20b]PYE92956.1 helix-turn-helix protein [Rhizobium sp. PP-F2F-G38]TCL89303.1 helix-turn-helix protein [Rhizobium sp. PP-WC-2G-219]TCP76489.1 helix-turn-helix protein [Rhizobium sp. PP-CC-2G-626]TCQ02014.1 helix-turn-helix protein [Rhizobium sp. PP-F2F-G36]TCQ16899.1 helix-turn-helix protein [Rhizobium sp. PP-CC-3G-465]
MCCNESERSFLELLFRFWLRYVMDLKETMAINLRRIRHEMNLTQEELADLAGLSARHIGAIERADKSATVTVLGQISSALGVEPAELLTKPS